MTKKIAVSAICPLLFAMPTRAQTEADPALLAEIEKIRRSHRRASPPGGHRPLKAGEPQ